MAVTPYLFFDGRCEEALDFYKKTLGAEVGMLMRVKDSPQPPPAGTYPPGSENKIMHSRVLDRELCGAVESNFHAASFSCSYHLLMAVSAARMDLAMGSTGLAAAGEMMASAGRSERL